jgi:hypothetical protein
MRQAQLPGHDAADAAAPLQGFVQPPSGHDMRALVDAGTGIGLNHSLRIHNGHIDDFTVLACQAVENIPQGRWVGMVGKPSLDQGQIGEAIVHVTIKNICVMRRKKGQTIKNALLRMVPEKISARAQRQHDGTKGASSMAAKKLRLMVCLVY